MTLWSRCKRWLADIFHRQTAVSETGHGAAEATCLVDCRGKKLDTTQVVDCQPSVELNRARTAQWAPRKHDEKRVSLRYPCDRPVLLRRRETMTDFFRGRIRNLSTSGIGIIVPDLVPTQTLLVIAIAASNGDIVHELPARVVHSRPMPVRGWFLGCEFAEQLELDQVKLLT
jgi:hypothetical protein